MDDVTSQNVSFVSIEILIKGYLCKGVTFGIGISIHNKYIFHQVMHVYPLDNHLDKLHNFSFCKHESLHL